MSSLSTALQVFVARRPAALEPAASTPPAAGSSYLAPFYWVLQRLTSFSSPTPDSHRLIFLTRYGLRLEQTKAADTLRYSVRLEQPAGAVGIDGGVGRRHYRILPDWQTSFLWKDAKFLTDGSEDSHIDDEEIEILYPRFAPAFFDWREFYEAAFVKQELHLGSNKELFPQLEDRVSWGVEGSLMAAWLVLQPDVDTVEYNMDGEMYLFRKDNVDVELNLFLDTMGYTAKDVNL